LAILETIHTAPPAGTLVALARLEMIHMVRLLPGLAVLAQLEMILMDHLPQGLAVLAQLEMILMDHLLPGLAAMAQLETTRMVLETLPLVVQAMVPQADRDNAETRMTPMALQESKAATLPLASSWRK
jgi:hypothetical protein